MEWLLPVILVVAVITLVGHGLWVVFAAILRRLSAWGGDPPPVESAAGACRRCGLPLAGPVCGVCRWPLAETTGPPGSAAALDALATQVERLVRLRILDPGAQHRFGEFIAAERARATPPQPTALPAAPVPMTPPAVEAVEIVAAELVEPIAPPPQTSPAQQARQFAAEHTVGERAAAYAAARQAAPPPVPATPAPRRSWTDLLAAFMEERNIRWGELVGGLLIVCCSIALVVSFWSAIAERPWLKFLVFNGVTAALFGLGFYSEHRWRLKTTSQGLLTIGSLLVPLNFLAIAAFSSAPDSGQALSIAGEAFSALLFAALFYFAGQVLVGRDEAWLAAGVLLPSLAQLLVRRFVGPATDVSLLVMLAALPVTCYLAANLWNLRRGAQAELDEPGVNALLRFLGLTTFAVVLPLGLLLLKTGDVMGTLRELPALASIVGFVPLSSGLLLWQRLAGTPLTALRTAGTSVAVGGALVAVAGLAVGWPEPGAMLPGALIDFAIFTFVAWRYGMPGAHLAAAPCVALAWLTAAHLYAGRIAPSGNEPWELARAFASGASGVLLVPLATAYYFAAAVARRRSAKAAGAFAAAGVAVAGLSTALVTWHGFGVAGDPLGATWVYLLYAAGLLAVAARSRRAGIAWSGFALLLAGVVQGIVFGPGARLELVHPYVTALLGFATLAGGIAAAARRLPAVAGDSPLAGVGWQAALGVSLVAAAWLTVLLPSGEPEFATAHGAWLAAVWLAVALGSGWLGVWTLFQLALAVVAACAVWTRLQTFDWFADSPHRWLDPWTVQAIAVALAALSCGWALARIIARRFPAAASLLASPWLVVDRLTTAALVVVLVALAVYAALPGVLVELSPWTGALPAAADFEIPGVPHTHAAGRGTWALLGGLLIVLAAVLRDRMSSGWLGTMFVVTAAAAPLVASRCEAQTAVATALWWCSAGTLLAGSAIIWVRAPISRFAARLGWQPLTGEPRANANLTALVFVLAGFPPMAMLLALSVSAIGRAGRVGLLLDDGFVAALAAIVAAAIASVILVRGAQAREARGRMASAWVLSAGAVPIVGLLLHHVASALAASPLVGPAGDSIFGRLGLPLTYAAPLAVAALVLVGYALRERRAGYALAGGLLSVAAATTAYLTAAWVPGAVGPVWLRLAQLTAAVSAAYTLGWVALLTWRRRGSADAPLAFDAPFSVQWALGPTITAFALAWGWLRLVQYPAGFAPAPPIAPQLADIWGWLSFALVVAGIVAAAWAARHKLGPLAASAALVAVATLAAAVAVRWDTGNWLAYNTLLVGHASIATLLLAAGRLAVRRESRAPGTAPRGAGWTVAQAAAVALLAAREAPENIWWTVAGLAYLGAAVMPLVSWIYQRRRYLYLAAPLVAVAALMTLAEFNCSSGLTELAYWTIVVVALPAPAWLAIELLAIRPRTFQPLIDAPPAHRVAARLVVAGLVLLVAATLSGDWHGRYAAAPRFGLDWIALGAALTAALACLWDAKARDSVALLYVLGLAACGVLVDGFNLSAPWLLWTGTIVLAAYALGTSYLWSRRRGLSQLAARLGIPHDPSAELAGQGWLVPANLTLVAAVVLMTVAIELTNGVIAQRVLASQATLAQAVSLALLARGDRRGVLQLGALKLGAIGAVMLGWSWLEVGTTLTLLHALVVVGAATAAVGAFYGLGLAKLLRATSDWLAPSRRITPWLAGTSAAALVAVLAVETFQFAQRGTVEIAWPAILVVAVTLAALALAALAAAVLPGRDPLSLSERGRTLYVYTAEIILALFFVHIRVTMPWLFRGFFQQFWPLVVMAIAYLGVGFSELCRRRRLNVLAEPLANTGALLPALPVLGYWAVDTRVDYSLLLVCVGVLYAGLSIARKSFGFGVVAALAANGGLWYFLERQDGLEFFRHPQVWLIPPAVCVLAAAYLNRRQLSEAQMTAIRYVTSMMIYLSSTADIFLVGVAQAPWLPLVLGGLAIAGVLAGIALRVRAFLFLGTGFLALAMFTIIWYAAVDLEQTWIWYAAGIVAGLAILATFAMFEKRRSELLDVFDRLKQWDA